MAARLRNISVFFALQAGDLAHRRTLDVAAGPSSFTAEAHLRGLRAVAIDPLYGLSPDALAAFVQVDYAWVLAEMRLKESLLRYNYFPSLNAAESSRRSAAERFLSDYEAGFVQNRYIGGSLPRLPVADKAFDLVLCAHLLFTYARHFDYAWHLAALSRELVRVSSTGSPPPSDLRSRWGSTTRNFPGCGATWNVKT